MIPAIARLQCRSYGKDPVPSFPFNQKDNLT